MGQFSRFRQKVIRKSEFVAKATAVEMGNQVVQNTPVDKGLAKASWQGAIGAPKSDLTPPLDRNPAIEFSVTLRELGIGDVAYFTNPQPYIIPLEYGWSALAPTGMIRRTVAKFKQIAAQKVMDSENVKF